MRRRGSRVDTVPTIPYHQAIGIVIHGADFVVILCSRPRVLYLDVEMVSILSLPKQKRVLERIVRSVSFCNSTDFPTSIRRDNISPIPNDDYRYLIGCGCIESSFALPIGGFVGSYTNNVVRCRQTLESSFERPY